MSFQNAPLFGEKIDPAWRTWGPYLSDRQWGTVREDYSANGDAWNSFPFDHSGQRAYRWGEDGLLGYSDDLQTLCFGLALWNGADPILKERLFGLTGEEGNHGEDVKEYYWYLDATPTQSYMRGLYRYPQRAFPYGELRSASRARSREEPEFELIDTGILDEHRYFDVEVVYAKIDPTDTLIRITVTNHGPEAATLDLLPSLWYRNTWSWGRDDRRPTLAAEKTADGGFRLIHATHPDLGENWLACSGHPDLLFTENDSNSEALWGTPNATPYVKDGIQRAIVHGEQTAVNPDQTGTKGAAHYRLELAAGASQVIDLRLGSSRQADPFAGVDKIIADRLTEANALYAKIEGGRITADEALVQRQALAGLIWSKQTFNYDVARWLSGDPVGPPPSPERRVGRNAGWKHHDSQYVISMPDKWEYPWYAAWDLAFHCIAFALVDRGFAKDQLQLLLRDFFMHPNGQIPAYEWSFSDVNPPVHLAAARAIYEVELRQTGAGDKEFLARIFHRLLLNFTWWVNQKDEHGRNLFEGGFLGLDNISVINRSMVMPAHLTLEQADGTTWMAIFSLNMAWAAIVLAEDDAAYEDLATKFLDNYRAIGGALNGFGDDIPGLWDEEDGFYYDHVQRDDGARLPLKVRSLVGLMAIAPSLGVTADLQNRLNERMPDLMKRVQKYTARHPELESLFTLRTLASGEQRMVLTLVPEDRLRRVLRRMFDPEEFLSDYGIRSISKCYEDEPYTLVFEGRDFGTVKYEPAESSSPMFGGNSNWRGPIWMPMNLLLVHGLRNLYQCYGDDFTIEYPTGSGQTRTLDFIADDISRRLVSIFLKDDEGKRPVFGGVETMQNDPAWNDMPFFYEYFQGDNGAGIGASHQTGWTACVANFIQWNAVYKANSLTK